MIYTQEQLMEVLEGSNAIVKMPNGYIINEVLQRALKTQKRANFCKNYPENFKGLSDILVYKRFMEEVEVPIMAKGDITYFVRTESKASIRKLKTILQDPEIDYDRLLLACKSYYKNTTALTGFAKFITNNIWEAMYNDRTEVHTTERDRKGTI